MARTDTIEFEFRRYRRNNSHFASDIVAELPGLLISQMPLSEDETGINDTDSLVLRFDFIDDYYHVKVFLDENKRPTGHYRCSMQTPLRRVEGIWKGDDLLLSLEVLPGFEYYITGEDEFFSAVEEGWMRVHSAAKAREILRRLTHMIENGCLPQEIMDAVET